MKATLLISALLLSYLAHGQYVAKVQRQVLFDVMRVHSADVLLSRQDSVIHAYQKDIAALEGTVSSCLILNTDYQNQIAYLKQIDFDSNKEIILLNKDNKRLKRQTRLLKILIPVVIAGTIWLSK